MVLGHGLERDHAHQILLETSKPGSASHTRKPVTKIAPEPHQIHVVDARLTLVMEGIGHSLDDKADRSDRSQNEPDNRQAL